MKHLEIELCGRVAVMLLRHHITQISSSIHSGELQGHITKLSELLKVHISGYRQLLGTNLAGLLFIDRCLKRHQEENESQLEIKTVSNSLQIGLSNSYVTDNSNVVNSSDKTKRQRSGKKSQMKRMRNKSLTMAQVTEGLASD